MADGNQRAYAALKYEGCAFPDTHPGHLWAVATLMGLSPPAPQTSRVLEIGCGDGGNLLPIAASLPKSQCVGLDLSAEHLALAERGRAGLGLRHLTLHHADLAQIEGTQAAGAALLAERALAVVGRRLRLYVRRVRALEILLDQHLVRLDQPPFPLARHTRRPATGSRDAVGGPWRC